jgi:hypothetical protein
MRYGIIWIRGLGFRLGCDFLNSVAAEGWAGAVVLLHPNKQKRSSGTPVRTMPTLGAKYAPKMGHPDLNVWHRTYSW